VSHHFLDTSALVKRYVQETGTDKIDALFADPTNHIHISRLSVTEWHSVLARKVRTGEVTRRAYQNALAHFYADLRGGRLSTIEWSRQHFRSSVRLLKQYGLSQAIRSLDALQLAVAEILHKRGEVDQFVCADRALCTLARARGLTVLNPEE